jgi:TrmH family RNA methyltransferase
MRKITSIQNDEIKNITQLIHAKERHSQQRCVVEGKRAIQTFIEAGHKLIQLYIGEQTAIEGQQLGALAGFTQAQVTLVTDQVMYKISTSTTPSGFLAVFKIPKSPSLPLTPGIVLANITDPGNVGTLIRTCAALGKKTVVVIEGADVWSPKVIQATVGTIALVNIFHLSWENLIKNKSDLKLCALVVADGTKPEELDLKESLLVVGNEAHGLPEEWINQSDQRLTIPMPGGTESLNAAVAGSIAMYVAWAQ